jgi:hypothetical protein
VHTRLQADAPSDAEPQNHAACSAYHGAWQHAGVPVHAHLQTHKSAYVLAVMYDSQQQNDTLVGKPASKQNATW